MSRNKWVIYLVVSGCLSVLWAVFMVRSVLIGRPFWSAFEGFGLGFTLQQFSHLIFVDRPKK